MSKSTKKFIQKSVQKRKKKVQYTNFWVVLLLMNYKCTATASNECPFEMETKRMIWLQQIKDKSLEK